MISSSANIRPEEWPRIRLMIGHSLCFGVCKIFSMTAANALFLTSFGAVGYPYLYIGTSICIPLFGLVFLAIEKKATFSANLRNILTMLLVFAILFRIGFMFTSGKWLVLAFALFMEMIFAFGANAYWGMAGRLFDVREGKRLFGLISTGEFVTWTAGGLLIPILMPFMGIQNMIWFTAAGLAGMLGMHILISRRFNALINRDVADEVEQTQPAGKTKNSLYLFLIYTFAVLLVIVFYFADILFYERLASRHVSPEETGAFLGIFFSMVGGLAIAGRTISGPAMSRFGVGLGLLAQPILLLMGVLAVYIMDIGWEVPMIIFWLTMGNKMIQRVATFSFTQPSMLVIYQPLPLKQRSKVLTTTNAIVEPIAGGVTGGLLLVMLRSSGMGFERITLVLILFLFIWLLVGLAVQREYRQTLMNALSRRILGSSRMDFNDQAGLGILKKGLASPHVGEVLYCMDLLDRTKPDHLSNLLLPMLDHASPEIRRDAVARIENNGIREASAKIRAMIDGDPDINVRTAAVRALIATNPAEAVEEILPMLETPEKAMRKGAIVGFIKNGEVEGIMAAGEHYFRLKDSEDPEDRVLAAEIIGEVGLQKFYRPLFDLLRDESTKVRRAALSACAKLKNPRLWPLVIENLEISECHSRAAAALAQVDDQIMPLIEAAFDKKNQSREFQIAIARACGRIKGDCALEFMSKYFIARDIDIRHGFLKSLVMRRFAASEPEQRLIRDLVREEAEEAARALNALLDIDERPDLTLVKNAILYEYKRSCERVFDLLSFIHPPEPIFRARDNLASPSREKKAYALELLDNFLTYELKQIVFPLFEPIDIPERIQRLHFIYPAQSKTVNEHLEDIIRGDFPFNIPWMRICALFTAGALNAVQLSDAVHAAMNDSEGMVRETALHVLWRMDPGAAATRAVALTNDRDPLAAMLARSIINGDVEIEEFIKRRSTVVKVQTLKQSSMFEQMPERWLMNLAGIMEFRELKPGHAIFHKGDMGDDMFIIVDGEVRVHDGDRDLAVLGPNSVFGEMSAIDPEPRSASITTLGDVGLFSIKHEWIREVMANHAEVAHGIMKVLVQRLRNISIGGVK